MLIAKEGFREIAAATLLLGACAFALGWLFWPLAIPFIVVWIWVLSFFRDPPRRGHFEPGDICCPADGTVTEIIELDSHDAFEGPVVRVGIFLSLFNVHINRVPCTGRVRAMAYQAGEFLDARHPESGRRNESNTILIDPTEGLPGPVEVRQVAGLVARRIICHANLFDQLRIGARFGLIKFGSRTEVVFPRIEGMEVRVSLGDKVKGGLTVVANLPVPSEPTENARSSSTQHEAAARTLAK